MAQVVLEDKDELVFAKEMQSLDQQSAEQIGLPTMVLMEMLVKPEVKQATGFLEDCFGKNIVVFTGKGNNGGDGLLLHGGCPIRSAGKGFLVSQELTGCSSTRIPSVFAGSVVLNYLHLRKTEAAGM